MTDGLQVMEDGCECPHAGWCKRHRMSKVQAQWRLCQQRPDYRALWDRRAPFQAVPPPVADIPDNQPRTFKKVGLGDMVAAALKKIGFKPCGGCNKRRAILNNVKIPFPARHAPEELRETVWTPKHGLPTEAVHDPRWAVGVTTAFRSQPSLIRSLSSLHAAGWTDVRVFAEPGSTLPLGVPGITAHDSVKGVFQNWRFALKTLRDEKPDAEFYAVLQDDVLYARNLKAFLESDLWFADDIGFVSPYRSSGKSISGRNFRRRRVRMFRNSEEYLAHREPYRDMCKPGDGLWGALTYIFPRASVDLLLADEKLKTRERTIDLAIYPVLAAHGRRAWYYNPSLADHMQGPSSIGHGQGRGMNSGGGFRGEAFDAMSLLEGVKV